MSNYKSRSAQDWYCQSVTTTIPI
uniref:Uncharacterized protein n=1 Tax=Arundo donax TaxID=35708 RepID=A0A0A9C1J8_ARUDO